MSFFDPQLVEAEVFASLPPKLRKPPFRSGEARAECECVP
jgi:hypothetical protein